MRKIELKTVPMGVHAGRQYPDLCYADALIEILGHKEAGVTIAEMRQAIAVMDKLTAARSSDHLLLEEAAWTYLCQRLDAHRFAIADPAIVAMDDAVRGAQSHDPS